MGCKIKYLKIIKEKLKSCHNNNAINYFKQFKKKIGTKQKCKKLYQNSIYKKLHTVNINK